MAMSTSMMAASLKPDLAITSTHALSGDDERLFDGMITRRVIRENLRPKRITRVLCLDPTIQGMECLEAAKCFPRKSAISSTFSSLTTPGRGP